MPTSLASEADLTEALADEVRRAFAERRALAIVGGGSKTFYGRPVAGTPLELAGHKGVVAYDPSELVITARAGTSLMEIEARLTEHGQMLAFEPPVLSPASTLGGAVAAGLSGPRRPFAGAVRDSVLGVKIVDGRGGVLRFGGQVFKNVAGFDAFRLMAGAQGRLGVILEVSLRVAPRPHAETCLALDLAWPAASARLTELMRRPLPLSGALHDGERLHLRLSGATAAVDAAARDLGGEAGSAAVWDQARNLTLGILAAPRLWRLSVPQLATISGVTGRWLCDWAGAQRWLVTDEPPARIRAAAAGVGGHATLFRGAQPGEAVFTPLAPPLLALHQRLTAALDPARILNPGRLYEDL